MQIEEPARNYLTLYFCETVQMKLKMVFFVFQVWASKTGRFRSNLGSPQNFTFSFSQDLHHFLIGYIVAPWQVQLKVCAVSINVWLSVICFYYYYVNETTGASSLPPISFQIILSKAQSMHGFSHTKVPTATPSGCGH